MKPLTLVTSQGGCAAKVGPDELYRILAGVPVGPDFECQQLLRTTDAGYIRVSQNLHIVQSIDVITPISDEPHTFGQIAVENALSDLFALRARPLCGLLLLGLPPVDVSAQVAAQIIRGAIRQLYAHGGVLLKGHTISTRELLFGVAVTGVLGDYAEDIGPQEGDALVLTKPLGSGIVSTALKLFNADVPIKSYSPTLVRTSEEIMLQSNAAVAAVMKEWNIHACTDVSGFGLLGHLLELLAPTKNSAEIILDSVPTMPGVVELAAQGIVASGGERNYVYWVDSCGFDPRVSQAHKMLLFDAQTSGGLLIALSSDQAEQFLNVAKSSGALHSSIIGTVVRTKGMSPAISVRS